MIAELEKAVGAQGEREKTLIIMDGGIASRENVQLLREEGFGYLEPVPVVETIDF